MRTLVCPSLFVSLSRVFAVYASRACGQVSYRVYWKQGTCWTMNKLEHSSSSAWSLVPSAVRSPCIRFRGHDNDSSEEASEFTNHCKLMKIEVCVNASTSGVRYFACQRDWDRHLMPASFFCPRFSCKMALMALVGLIVEGGGRGSMPRTRLTLFLTDDRSLPLWWIPHHGSHALAAARQLEIPIMVPCEGVISIYVHR